MPPLPVLAVRVGCEIVGEIEFDVDVVVDVVEVEGGFGFNVTAACSGEVGRMNSRSVADDSTIETSELNVFSSNVN